MTTARDVLATLLRHEAKTNTYKFALIRALNDLALEHAFLPSMDIVVPLRRVAERWLVYYWGFAGERPVYQGPRASRGEKATQDMSFRALLTELRAAWERLPGTRADPAQGALLIADYRAGRGRLPETVQELTRETLRAISLAVRQPLRFAGGTGEHTLFGAPAPVAALVGQPLPGSLPSEPGFIVPALLWRALTEWSLWVEALCLHEWCLYTERVRQEPPVGRGEVFALLTAVPAGRVPLSWERHQVRLQMLEGAVFRCPWTERVLTPEHFDLDHLIPVSTLPINELWNLVPSDPAHNAHVKRHRIASSTRLAGAQALLSETYRHYSTGKTTRQVLTRDVTLRFGEVLRPEGLAAATVHLAEAIAVARNVPRY